MQSAVAVLNTKPSQNLSLSDQEIFILRKTLRSSLTKLQFELLVQQNNLSGTGTDWDYTRALEREIKASTRLLARLTGDQEADRIKDNLEADLERLERITLAAVAFLFAAEREAAG